MSTVTLVAFFMAHAIKGDSVEVIGAALAAATAVITSCAVTANAVSAAITVAAGILIAVVAGLGIPEAGAPGVILLFLLCLSAFPSEVARDLGLTRKRIWVRFGLQFSGLFVIIAGYAKGLIPSVWIPTSLALALGAVLFMLDPIICRRRIRKREQFLARKEELRSRISDLSTDEQRVQYRVAPDLEPKAFAEAELVAVQEELSRLDESLGQKAVSP